MPTTEQRIEAVETHFAWVFLTDRHAYKLKKPVRVGRAWITQSPMHVGAAAWRSFV